MLLWVNWILLLFRTVFFCCFRKFSGYEIHSNYRRYLGQETHSNYRRLCAFTRDIETEGHVIFYVTFVISAYIYPSAMIFLLLCKVFMSRNSFQLLPFAWPSRLTLKLKVTSWSTWLMLFLLVLILPTMIILFRKVYGVREFILTILPLAWLLRNDLETQGQVRVYVTFVISACKCPTAMNFFVRFSGQVIHSNYCHLRDYHVWPWNARSRHGLHDLTTWQNKKSRRPWRDLQFQGHTWRSRNWRWNFHKTYCTTYILHTSRVYVIHKKSLSRYFQLTQDWTDKAKWRSIEASNNVKKHTGHCSE